MNPESCSGQRITSLVGEDLKVSAFASWVEGGAACRDRGPGGGEVLALSGTSWA